MAPPSAWGMFKSEEDKCLASVFLKFQLSKGTIFEMPHRVLNVYDCLNTFMQIMQLARVEYSRVGITTNAGNTNSMRFIYNDIHVNVHVYIE